MKGFPFISPIQVRWRDLDSLGHVNNAAFVTYLEVARTAAWHQLFGKETHIPFFVTLVEIQYRRQVGLYDEVRVGLRVAEMRGARFSFEYRIEADGELAAEARTVLGYIRPDSGRAGRIPPESAAKLAKLQDRADSEF
jgi:acyl-CoA thioester hydrolase